MYRTFPIRSKRSNQKVLLLSPIPVDPNLEKQFKLQLAEKGETTPTGTTPTDYETTKHSFFFFPIMNS